MYDTKYNITGFKMTILYLKQYFILFIEKGIIKIQIFLEY